MAEKILRTEYTDEMQKSYLDYSMSVITARAVPDIRDGLKPVQRRLLYDMDDLHVHHDRKEMKSARICGDTMGRFHPHGDSSIYETMVVMSQDFKKSVPLVDGKGNFGSVEGDSAAAYRYTEAKLRRFTDEVFLKDIDKAVDYVQAYTNTEGEPEVLPVRIPNFLLNGSEGIAVGMTTSTPCHNLSELCDLCSAYVDNKEMTLEQMMEILPGPDFPTGGIVANKSELADIYRTGSGKIKIRGKVEYVPAAKRSEKDRLVVTEIPYTMIGAGIGNFMQDVADLIEAKKITDISDIGNASDKDGISIFLELKKDADIQKIINILYKKTKLEDTFGVNMLAISGGRPEVMTLKTILSSWLSFQHTILEKKYKVLLEKEQDKREIQEGLIAAYNILDLVIAVIRGAKNRKDAEDCLTKGDVSGISFRDPSFKEDAMNLRFTDRQAKAILEMQLYKLIGLEIMELKKAYQETMKAIKEYTQIISDPAKREQLIKADLSDIKSKFGYPRRTQIEDAETVVVENSEPEDIPCVFLMDRMGYCKLCDPAVFEKNRETVEEENRYVVSTSTCGKILIFTDTGDMHLLKMSQVPFKKIREKGLPVDNLTRYKAAESEILFLDADASLTGKLLMFMTAFANIKLVPAEEFETNNRLVQATKLEDGDKVVSMEAVSEIGMNTVACWADNGNFIRFALDDIPIMKKNSKGVRAMKLAKGALAMGAKVVDGDAVVKNGSHEVHLNTLKIAVRGGVGSRQKDK